MKTILLVCTGNTCRSIMAQALAEKLAKDWDLAAQFKILSAGTAAYPGAPASPQAVEVLREEGIDLQNHRASQVKPEQVKEADLILTMTSGHKEQLVRMVPEAKDKIFTLKEFASDPGEIRDAHQQLMQLAASVEEKERQFHARYGAEIEKLEQEFEQLRKRLDEIRAQLEQYQSQFEAEIQGEREKMQEIERESLNFDVADPIGQPLEVYRECAREIKDALEKALRKLSQGE